MEQNYTENSHPEHAVFSCPSCGVLDRDEVVFLCNTCTQSEVIYKDGIYMCPSCLAPGHNFQCMKCDSKDVTMSLEEGEDDSGLDLNDEFEDEE